MKTHPFLLLVGPTASGKSALALRLAEALGGSILNCDSVQFYRRLDIGSAKPNAAERARVPHFLFDVLGPGEVLTAGDFRRLAIDTLTRELARGPVLGVGGSGFYIQALEKGMFDVPKPDPAVEAKVRTRFADRPEEMYAELQRLDPEYASTLNANDAYRILRALVIHADSGKKVSELRREFTPEPFPFPLLKFGLRPTREVLLPRIERRTQSMLAQGLMAEVRALVQEGFADWPPLQSVGYRECLQVLRGELSEEKLPSRIVEKTLQLSKKQKTWFKRDLEIEWLDGAEQEAEARVRTCLDRLA